MPKVRKQEGRGKKSSAKRIKFKIGNRKSPKSALTLSTAALQAMLEKPGRRRDVGKILGVLRSRGVSVNTDNTPGQIKLV